MFKEYIYIYTENNLTLYFYFPEPFETPQDNKNAILKAKVGKISPDRNFEA